MEHPGRRLLATKIDDPVFVAINTEGVYVIDRDDFVSFIAFSHHYTTVISPGFGAGVHETKRVIFSG